MKKLLIALAVLFIGLPCIVFAVEQNELPLRKGIKLPSPEDVNHILLSAAPDGAVYPAVIERSGGLDFLDNSGNKKVSVAFPKTYGEDTISQTGYSENQKYVMIHTTKRGEEIGRDDRVAVYDVSGQVLWSTHAAYGSHYVAPNGQFVVCLFPNVGVPNYPPTFLGKNGIMNAAIVNYNFAISDKWFPDAETNPIGFSPDSSLVAVGITSHELTLKHKSFVVLFDGTGHIISRFELPVGSINKLAISQDNKMLAVSGGNAYLPYESGRFDSFVLVVDVASGQLIWNNKVAQGAHYLSFADAGDGLLAATEGGNSAYYFDARTGKIFWEFSDKGSKDFSFKSAVIQGNRIILSGEERGPNGFDALFVLDQKGRLLGRKRLAQETIRRFQNNHLLLPIGGKIGVPEKDSVEVLDIPSE